MSSTCSKKQKINLPKDISRKSRTTGVMPLSPLQPYPPPLAKQEGI